MFIEDVFEDMILRMAEREIGSHVYIYTFLTRRFDALDDNFSSFGIDGLVDGLVECQRSRAQFGTVLTRTKREPILVQYQ